MAPCDPPCLSDPENKFPEYVTLGQALVRPAGIFQWILARYRHPQLRLLHGAIEVLKFSGPGLGVICDDLDAMDFLRSGLDPVRIGEPAGPPDKFDTTLE
jgi:hypothetical protein